jgi:transketolase
MFKEAKGARKVTLLAMGSEVEIALKAREILEEKECQQLLFHAGAGNCLKTNQSLPRSCRKIPPGGQKGLFFLM